MTFFELQAKFKIPICDGFLYNNSHNLPKISGVYVIATDSEIMYIGSSKDIRKRVYRSDKLMNIACRKGCKRKTIVYVVPFKTKEKYLKYEKIYLNFSKPLFNINAGRFSKVQYKAANEGNYHETPKPRILTNSVL